MEITVNVIAEIEMDEQGAAENAEAMRKAVDQAVANALKQAEDNGFTHDLANVASVSIKGVETVSAAATVSLFTFDQLSEEAKAKAISDYQDKHDWPEWDDVDLVTEQLAENITNVFGLCADADAWRGRNSNPDIKISWDSCQGVGLVGRVDSERIKRRLAAKELTANHDYGRTTGQAIIDEQDKLASAIEALEALDELPNIDVNLVSLYLTRRSEFSTDSEVEIEFFIDDENENMINHPIEDMIEAARLAVAEAFEEYMQTVSSFLFRIIEEDIEYHNSAECIAEDFLANDRLFEADGTAHD